MQLHMPNVLGSVNIFACIPKQIHGITVDLWLKNFLFMGRINNKSISFKHDICYFVVLLHLLCIINFLHIVSGGNRHRIMAKNFMQQFIDSNKKASLGQLKLYPFFAL